MRVEQKHGGLSMGGVLNAEGEGGRESKEEKASLTDG